MKKLEIWFTPTAEKKLKEIYIYSCKQWGKRVAEKYMLKLNNAINAVASGEKHTRINPNFCTRFSYLTSEKHHIFFEFRDKKLIVVTVFHTMMSIKERMEEEMSPIKKQIDSI